MARNHFEAAGRRAKVAALTRHVEELVELLGLTSASDGYIIAELIRGWDDQEWAQACVNVGKAKASVETRLAVINGFVERARKVAS